MVGHPGVMPLTYDDLRLASLARQFPLDAPSEPAELLATTGPIQSQTARSSFLGLAARSPGLTRAAISSAFDDHLLLRGSTIRGTVHTMTPRHQQVLDATTRVAQRPFWRRTLAPESLSLEEVWSALESHAWNDWHTSDELLAHLRAILTNHHERVALSSLDTQAGRYFGIAHGGFVRRPLSGGWEGQGRAGYRAAEAISGLSRMDADEAVRQAVRLHVRHHGPSSRYDIAWWSGLGLRPIDAAVVALGDELVHHGGPDGRVYLDTPHAPAPRDLEGVVLIPEFDALMCGYDSKARDRFVSPEHHEQLWTKSNGLSRAPLLVDGRLTGYWRMTGAAAARQRPVEVRWFSRTRRPRKAEVEEQLQHVETALGVTAGGVTITRE